MVFSPFVQVMTRQVLYVFGIAMRQATAGTEVAPGGGIVFGIYDSPWCFVEICVFLQIVKTTNYGDVSHEKETSLWRTSQTTRWDFTTRNMNSNNINCGEFNEKRWEGLRNWRPAKNGDWTNKTGEWSYQNLSKTLNEAAQMKMWQTGRYSVKTQHVEYPLFIIIYIYIYYHFPKEPFVFAHLGWFTPG